MRSSRSSLPGLFVLCIAAITVAAAQTSAQTPAQASSQTAPPKQVALAKDYGKLPLSFEANRGQVDPQVRFLSRGNGYSLFLTGKEAVLSLRRTEKVSFSPANPLAKLQTKQRPALTSDVVRMQLAGASPATQISGADQLPGTANYFIGNDPTHWRSNVPTFAKVRYEGVYPGVDLVYYGNQQQLEYDFIVKPGADARSIRLHFAGEKKLKLSPDGDLEIVAKNGQIAFHKPVVYQQIAGVRQQVRGSFKLFGRNEVSFNVGSYDISRDLVIDPTLAYSTYLGGSSNNYANGISVDASGNAYVTGQTQSSDFPVTSGAFHTTTISAYGTCFVSKLNPTGTALLYSTYLGGSGGEACKGIAVDTYGDAYVAGETVSADFPATKGAFQVTDNGQVYTTPNAFVAEINPTGSSLIYATYLGGSGGLQNTGDQAFGIAIDGTGDAYVVGTANSSNFPVTQGAFQTHNNGLQNYGSNAFITKLNATGSGLIYSTYLGGTGQELDSGDVGTSIAVDQYGSAYVTGYTVSSDFPVTQGAFNTTLNLSDGPAAFVTKFNPTGSDLTYSTYIGHSYAGGLALDPIGNVYLAGNTYDPSFPVTMGAFQPTYNLPYPGTSPYVTKLNSSGSALIYSTFLSGSGYSGSSGEPCGDSITGVAVDSSGNAYVTGETCSTNFPVTADAFQSTRGGGTSPEVINAFITELNTAGSSLVYVVSWRQWS